MPPSTFSPPMPQTIRSSGSALTSSSVFRFRGSPFSPRTRISVEAGCHPIADRIAADDYETQAREFLRKGREYLAAGDLHQASEKGWGAAAHMAKAVAVAQGWHYETHADFSAVLNRATAATGDDRLRGLRGIANDLHGNYYRRSRHLDAAIIGKDLEGMDELLRLLGPLARISG